MVNGSAGPTAELHHGDLFQGDLFQEDQPKELKVEEPADVFSQQKEHSDPEEKGGVNEKEEEDEKEEESPKAGEDEKLKRDALDDLYSSLASADMYSLSTLAKPWESNVRVKNNNLFHFLNLKRNPCKPQCILQLCSIFVSIYVKQDDFVLDTTGILHFYMDFNSH